MIRRHAITAQVDSQSTVAVDQVREDGVANIRSCPRGIENGNAGSSVECNDIPGARGCSANRVVRCRETGNGDPVPAIAQGNGAGDVTTHDIVLNEVVASLKRNAGLLIA